MGEQDPASQFSRAPRVMGAPPPPEEGWAGRAGRWAQEHRGIVTLVSALALGGSLAVSYLPDDRATLSSGPGQGPAFEPPPRAPSPQLRRAGPESLVRPPAGDEPPAAAQPAEEPAAGAGEPAPAGETADYDPLAAAAASAQPRPKKGLEPLKGLSGTESQGGSSPSASAGRAEERGSPAREASPLGASGGALAFVKRQLGNAGKRLGRIFGATGGSSQRLGGGPPAAGHASAPGGVTTRSDTGVPSGGGLGLVTTGAAAPPSGAQPATVAQTSGGSAGGGGGGGGPAPAAAPKPAPKPAPAPAKAHAEKSTAAPGELANACSKDKASTRCAVLTCVDAFDVWPVLPALSTALHAADSGGLIVLHHEGVLKQAEEAKRALDGLYGQAAGLSFDCEECHGLEGCARDSERKIKPAKDKAKDAADLLPKVIAECKLVPFRQLRDGSACKELGDKAKDADLALGKAIREAARAADCSAEGPEDEVARWNAWAQTVRQALEPLAKTFDQALCPNRTKCDPGNLAPAFERLEKGTKDIEVFHEDLPSVIPLLSQARGDGSQALGFLRTAPNDEGALRDFVFATDRAALAVTKARSAFDAEKAAACRTSGTATGADGARTRHPQPRDTPLRERAVER